MSKLLRFVLVLAVVLVGLPAMPSPAHAQVSHCDPDGRQASGAIYRICMPAPGLWNGDLVIFAHGYVSPTEPLAIPEDQLELPGGTSLPELVNALGFAFAVTSYSTNGLAVVQGVADVTDLVGVFAARYGQPNHTYLTGASEGGLVTVLAVEQKPQVFSGGLATCGPVGDFRKQVNHFGDFRVVFDYFFPGVLPFSPISIPGEAMANWKTVYEPAVLSAIAANPDGTRQLLAVTRTPVDPADPSTVGKSVVGNLWYNVFATNDAQAKLGGQPFDNARRIYVGSDDDLLLNAQVQRFSADPAAIAEINRHYQTSGRLTVPLVTMHNIGDPIVPYTHEPQYRMKVLASGAGKLYNNIPIARWGHCNFQPEEVLVAFALLVLKATGQAVINPADALPNDASREAFYRLAQEYGVPR